MRFSVDGWDPGYGTAVEMDGLPESQAQVDTTIEVSAANWAPIPPKAGDTAVTDMLFVDGVRRIDARLRSENFPARHEHAVHAHVTVWVAGCVRK